MKIRADLTDELVDGLAEIRRQYKVPAGFPEPVLAAAAEAISRRPTKHVDRTEWPFVTLDPAAATDLDQAFHIEAVGDDLLLHYAIADVAWFVHDRDPVDEEAWQRGTTQYLPDGRASLYPAVLSEGAASLLPDGPRPAVVFHVRIDATGGVKLDGAERSLVHSRAKLGYEATGAAQLPKALPELARRIVAAEERRGASRVESPEQEVRVNARGGYDITFRPRTAAQDQNEAMSLATNLAVADALLAAGTGLFRVMPDPNGGAEQRLRHTARALGLDWPPTMTLRDFERTLHNGSPKPAAMAMAIRRAGHGASYVPFTAGERPWHAAMAATYVHATAPLRRLGDRYVVMAALAVANGQPVADEVQAAFPKLSPVMERADHTASQIERAVIELAEAVLLSGQVQRTFPAVVTDVDERGARIQLCDLPVVSRIDAHGVAPGDDVRVRIENVDIGRRTATLKRVA
ncbi:MAG TPA: RNB domain-containing ribonuclease [Ilumatobacteraceae bacterium]